MNVALSQMDALLAVCFPTIASIEWKHFGEKLAAYDDKTDIPKCTGVLSHFTGQPIVGASTRVHGFLSDPQKSASVVVSKVRLLQANLTASASMELRDPEKLLWGGGIRSSQNPDEIYALTGLPEIGDHLTAAWIMRACGLLQAEDFAAVTNLDTVHMAAAMEFVGMSRNQFAVLERLIYGIVMHGMDVVK